MSDSEPKPTVQYIDISKGPLGESYPLPHFVMVIDNAFTPAKCAEILAIGKSTQEEWGEGLINNGRGQQVKAIDVRNCGRIIRDDPELAERLLARVRPFLKDVELVGGGASPEWPVIIGGAPITWKITRCVYVGGQPALVS